MVMRGVPPGDVNFPGVVPLLQRTFLPSPGRPRLNNHLSHYYGGPAVRLPGGINQNLVPAGILNGQMVYRIAADVVNPSAPAAAPVNPSASKKKKRAKQQDDDRPYIKKPPNAFTLFRKEQRPKVVAELNVTTSAVVNGILGQRWKSLSKEEQAKYYEEAQNERLLHFQQHPSWSAKENYGKKRKRTTCKAPTSSVKASVSNPGEVPQPAKKICVTPPHTAATEPSNSLTGMVKRTTSPAAVMEPSASPKAVMEPSTSQAEVTELCTSQSVPNGHQTAEIPPVCDLYNLLEEYDCHWSDSPAVPQETMEFDYLFIND